MKTIHHVFDVDATRDRVYAALTQADGLAGWWTTKVRAGSSVGDEISFAFEAGFNPVMEITELVPASVVAWRCIAGHDKWADNDFHFELAGSKRGTRVRFWQHYAVELPDDDYGTYNYNWGYYLESLRLLLTTGEGKPYQPAG